MLTSNIFIGVGGSGGNTLRFLWQELENRLQMYDWSEGMPSAWQFIHIDAPQIAEEGDGNVPSELRDSEHYLGLAKNGIKFSEYTKSLSKELEVLAGWRPDPNNDWGPIWKGAAQRRAVGRVIAMANLSEVGERLDQSLQRMTGTESLAQLSRLATLMGVQADSKAPPLVCLISSLGGGAGAGMFLDVSLLLRGHATTGNEFLNEHFTILYPADVFGSLPPASRAGIAPNTLAGISEMLSAIQHEGELDESDARILNRSGSAQRVSGNRTSRVNFIMGSRNEQVQFTSMNDVYKSTARGLAAIVTNGIINETLTNQVLINSFSFSGPKELTAFSRRNELSSAIQPGSSFGYAAVSMGRYAFAEYGAERIAREVVESMIKSEAELQQELLRHRNEIDERARDFARRCELLELDVADEAHNQVLDSLRDFKAVKTQTEHLASTISERFAQTTNDTKKWTNAQWKKGLSDDFKRDAPSVESAVDAQLSASAKLWAEAVQVRLINETMRSIPGVGLPETLYYLERLDEDLIEASGQLEQSKAVLSSAIATVNGVSDKIFDVLDKVEAMTINSTKPKSFLDNLREVFSRGLEIKTRELARDLINDLVVGFVRPLVSELQRAKEEFVGTMNEHANKVEFDSWSSGPVATHLYPAPNERFLMPVDGGEGFEATFEQLLMTTFGINDRDGALVAAASEVIGGFDDHLGGNWPTRQYDEKGQVRLEETAKWIPTTRSARPSESNVAKKARFSLDLTLEEIHNDARKWMKSRTGVAEFTNQMLKDYLNDEDAPDGAERRRTFVNELKLALSMAEPMVNFNKSALRYFHEQEEVQSVPVIGRIPLNPAFTESDDVKNLLQGAGFSLVDSEKALDVNAPGAEVEIARFIVSFVHPVVMDSVMKPLAQEWARERDADASRKLFWQTRRARTLPSFIPLAPSVQTEMAKGWQVARVLGYVTDESIDAFKSTEGSTPISIWTSDGVKCFPQQLLNPDYRESTNIFPALMESFMLAFLDVSAGDNEALEAYRSLGRLGAGSEQILQDWIIRGLLEGMSDGVTPDAHVAGSVGQSPDERKSALVAALQGRFNAVQTGVASLKLTEENFAKFTRSWELRELVMNATQELLNEVNGALPQNQPSA